MYNILIIEDDLTIAKTLCSHLQKWDYQAVYLTDFKNIVEQFLELDPQLLLLDISLPFYNGYHWCNEIRKVSKVPIIFISSASENMNIVMAMNLGADDFIAKPFDLNVLTAKVQAILRRSYAFAGQVNVMEHKQTFLNISDNTFMYLEQKIELTKNEFKILQILFENIGKTVSRDAIMTRLWENDSYIDDNTLTVNITRLRKKLAGLGLEEFILTRKGIGYIIE
ncbi:response regulator transcription factor [Anaerosacchariphilus polymeriproducens]|uniref:Stage 0 sporulation protein A homolog n=1 Tax=Anaerosacchariphilus polymeriproducens TaxID=1812858 RepID=A0A371AXH9_9FIRM|nr:response regulator transcription factor [Anaerosacchariphilus polymeriproducens]RDU24251.1 DNA-binding response regulator [Anaerosacchariphilus polymeriproducens]